MKVFKELFSFIIKKRETQKEIPGGFYLSTTVTICIHSAELQITVNHWQLPIVWEHWSAKKNLEITKMADHFSHTKKRILKLPKLKDLFFCSNFIIQIHLNVFQNSNTQGTCIRHIRI